VLAAHTVPSAGGHGEGVTHPTSNPSRETVVADNRRPPRDTSETEKPSRRTQDDATAPGVKTWAFNFLLSTTDNYFTIAQS